MAKTTTSNDDLAGTSSKPVGFGFWSGAFSVPFAAGAFEVGTPVTFTSQEVTVSLLGVGRRRPTNDFVGLTETVPSADDMLVAVLRDRVVLVKRQVASFPALKDMSVLFSQTAAAVLLATEIFHS